MLHRHPNTPAHLFIDDAPYFITGAIYQKRKLLRNAALKQGLLDKIRANTRHFGWTLEHWVILDNHYHLMLRSRRGDDLPELMQRVHGGTCTILPRPRNAPSRFGGIIGIIARETKRIITPG